MDWKEIESRQNPLVKFASSLGEKKTRDREEVFSCEGATIFFDLCKAGVFPETLFLSADKIHLKEKVETALSEHDCQTVLLSPGAFEKISTEKASEGILTLYSQKKISRALPVLHWRRLVALENVQDPGNVGTVIRTAAALGFDGVLLVGGADPFGPKAVRASMGAFARIPILSFSDTKSLFSALEEKGVRSIASCLAPEAKQIGQTLFQEPVCVLIGNEGSGLTPEAQAWATEKSRIPMSAMESLNAAAAGAIFLWEIARRSDQ